MIMDLSEGEILRSVDTPLHVVSHTGVETSEVLFRDDMVIVQIQHVVEKMSELVLLEV